MYRAGSRGPDLDSLSGPTELPPAPPPSAALAGRGDDRASQPISSECIAIRGEDGVRVARLDRVEEHHRLPLVRTATGRDHARSTGVGEADRPVAGTLVESADRRDQTVGCERDVDEPPGDPAPIRERSDGPGVEPENR